MLRGRTVGIIVVIVALVSSLFTATIIGGNEWIGSLIKEDSTTPPADSQNKSAENVPKDMEKLLEAYQIIYNSSVEEQNTQSLIDGAIRGMVETLEDPHSTYMTADEANDFYGTLDSSFEGIGAEVTIENGKITVIAPIKGSPSEKAGIRPRDQIIEVDGKSLEGFSLFEAVKLIRGPKGTKVILKVERPGVNTPLTISVVRDEIPIETVHMNTIKTSKGLVGKIEISNFAEETAKDFEKALLDLEKQNIKGLIIDVRGNPGGYLQSVLKIGNLVIPNKGIILQVEDRSGKRQHYKSEMEVSSKYPIVTIINNGSASASEILAGALQESAKYPVVGDTSYGKGTVQNPFELKDRSSLKLTVAKWLTPDGNWIHKKGVVPDVQISQPDYFHAMPFSKDMKLSKDMNSADVKNLQLILSGLGYKPGRMDGYFDETTELAVRTFQKTHGLEATGIVDSKTAALLQEKIIEKIKSPESDLQLRAAIDTIVKIIK